jgi:hypothetical protein
MSDQLWSRLGAASGILYVVLLLVGSSITGGGVEATTAEATARGFAEAAINPTLAVGFFLEIVAFLCFLFFLGSLWSALRRAEGDTGWLSMVAFGGGLMSLTIKLASLASLGAAYHANEGLDPQLAQTLQDMAEVSFFISFFPLVVMLLASAIVAIRYGALPRWLGWTGVGVAITLLGGGLVGGIYGSDDAGLPFLLFLLWTLMISIALMWRVGKPVPAVSSASVSLPPAMS